MANVTLSVKRQRKSPQLEIERAISHLEKHSTGSLKPLNFKVPADFHREFKVYASQQGISMLDLLREGFKVVRERRG